MTADNFKGNNVPLLVEKVTKVRGTALFSPVSFTLHAGEGIGIYGHNGCGKTTLLDMIAGVRSPDAGEIKLGVSVGYVMQSDGFQDSMTCRDNLLFEAALCGLRGQEARQRVELAAEQCGVSDFLGKRLSRCSAGMRGRLSIAAALIPKPGVLLLDEAFSALDSETHSRIKSLLFEQKESGTALVLVSHSREDFDGLCERVLTLPDGEVNRI